MRARLQYARVVVPRVGLLLHRLHQEAAADCSLAAGRRTSFVVESPEEATCEVTDLLSQDAR